METLINNDQLKILHTLLSKLGLMEDKKEIVYQYSRGRETSSKNLRSTEARYLIGHLKKQLGETPQEEKKNKMKKKILGMAHEMNWEKHGTTAVDMMRVNHWCKTSSYLKKPLDSYTYNELPKLVSQFENVHKHYLNK